MHSTPAGVKIPVLIIFLAALSGCSNFDREWREAKGRHPTGIDGRWEGSWKSEQEGHSGALQCVIRQTRPDEYAAFFDAVYGGFLHFTYDAKLTGRQAAGVINLTGQEDLGWPVGVYQYQGAADPRQFWCAYRSKDDHGYFALARERGTPPIAPIVALHKDDFRNVALNARQP